LFRFSFFFPSRFYLFFLHVRRPSIHPPVSIRTRFLEKNHLRPAQNLRSRLADHFEGGRRESGGARSPSGIGQGSKQAGKEARKQVSGGRGRCRQSPVTTTHYLGITCSNTRYRCNLPAGCRAADETTKSRQVESSRVGCLWRHVGSQPRSHAPTHAFTCEDETGRDEQARKKKKKFFRRGRCLWSSRRILSVHLISSAVK
ncbi:hypothetical protein IWX46DRAFT_604624, partial [Phyllosticta citricarpa]